MPPLKRPKIVMRELEDTVEAPPKFSMGRIVVTPAAEELLNAETLYKLVRRHNRGDWGDISEDDRQSNEDALKSEYVGFMSVYNLPQGTIWLITDAGRRVTTALTPSDY